MPRRDGHHTSAETHVNDFILDDGRGDGSSDPFQINFLPIFVFGISLVFGVHDHIFVAKLCFRARGRNHKRAVLEIIQRVFFLSVRCFQVCQRGLVPDAPVDDALPAIDETLFVKINERLLGFLHDVRIQREFFAAPVAGGAEFPELRLHRFFVFQREGKHLLVELVARDGKSVSSFLFQFFVKDHLGLKPGMVRAREPERLESPHPFVANNDVLERHKNRMADV